MEIVSFALELSRGVDFVGHDARDGLLHVLHPLDHLGLTHDVHVLDERVVLLPERHLDALTSRPVITEATKLRFLLAIALALTFLLLARLLRNHNDNAWTSLHKD